MIKSTLLVALISAPIIVGGCASHRFLIHKANPDTPRFIGEYELVSVDSLECGPSGRVIPAQEWGPSIRLKFFGKNQFAISAPSYKSKTQAQADQLLGDTKVEGVYSLSGNTIDFDWVGKTVFDDQLRYRSVTYEFNDKLGAIYLTLRSHLFPYEMKAVFDGARDLPKFEQEQFFKKVRTGFAWTFKKKEKIAIL